MKAHNAQYIVRSERIKRILYVKRVKENRQIKNLMHNHTYGQSVERVQKKNKRNRETNIKIIFVKAVDYEDERNDG